MTNLTIIVAIGQNEAIGRNGKLPWSGLRGELKWFKQATIGHTVIMGRKTWESLPGALSGRLNVVISSSDKVGADRRCGSLSEAVNKYPDAMIIGGAEIYKQAIPITDTMLITRVHMSPEGCDTFFPEFDSSEWTTERNGISDENWHVEVMKRIRKIGT